MKGRTVTLSDSKLWFLRDHQGISVLHNPKPFSNSERQMAMHIRGVHTPNPKP